MDRLQISYDRGNCNVRLLLKDGFERYKKTLSKHWAFFEESFIVPMSVAPCPDGYCCTVKGQRSIKEYLAEEEPSCLALLHLLIENLKHIRAKCAAYKLHIEDFIFDYSAVFVNDSLSDMHFVYMPGARLVHDLPSYIELIEIIYLHAYQELSEEAYFKIGELLMFFELGNDKNFEMLCLEIKSVIEPYLLEKQLSSGEKLGRWIRSRTIAFPSKKSLRKIKKEKKSLKNIKGPRYVEIVGEKGLDGVCVKKEIGERNNIIRIGRDRGWSDIVVNDLTASRKHAELHIDKSGNLKIRDMSLNGTNVDGKRMSSKEKDCKKDRDVKILITEECGVLVRYKNA